MPMSVHTPKRSAALLFGINYVGQGDRVHLKGCSTDMCSMRDFLVQSLPNIRVEMCTDDAACMHYSHKRKNGTTRKGMISHLTDMARRSSSDDLELVVIHYSGHGTSNNNCGGGVGVEDENGLDECLVPSDYQVAGCIRDDFISRVLTSFNPKTRILFVCDTSNSGTICNLPVRWVNGTPLSNTENNLASVNMRIKKTSCPPNIASLSVYKQKSIDNFKMEEQQKYEGTLTSCMIRVLNDNPMLRKDFLTMYQVVTELLEGHTFSPVLCSNYDLRHTNDVV